MASTNFVVGRVGSLTGNAYARNEIGEKRALKLGDEIYEGDLVLADAGGRVEIDFGVGRTYAVTDGQQVVIDTTIYGDGEIEATRLAVLEREAQFHSIETQIASGTQSLDSLLEATASGGGGTAADGGHGRATLSTQERNSEETSLGQLHLVPVPNDNSYTPSAAPAASLSATPEAALSVQSLTAAQVQEGGNLVHTVVLNHSANGAQHLDFALNLESASASDIGNLSFSNGVTLQDGQLTIPAGVSSFSINIATSADRLAESTETLSLTVGGVSVQDGILDNASMRLAAPAFAWHLAEPMAAAPAAANLASLQAHDLISPADPLAQFLGHAATPALATGHHELATMLAPGLALHEVQQHTPA